MEVSGRTALVIGAQRPLGRAIAVALADGGVDVAVAGVSAEPRENFRVHSVANELWAMDRRSIAVTLDVRDPASVGAAVQQIDSEWGRLDILVVAQDRLLALPFDETGPDEWAEMLDANLTSAALACQAAGRLMMRERAMHGARPGQGGGVIGGASGGAIGGAIVNVVSTPAVEAGAGFVAYAAAAGGLVAMSRALAAEWAEWGIAVSVVEAGFGEDALLSAAPREAAHPPALPDARPTPNASIAAAVVDLIASGESGGVRRVRPTAS
ncbi:MAG: 3-oxoacyl-[acyl-carrier protein] reductase [Chloroflexi bacterium]|nr:MAG: 3-oxoacyl-[acyl-carrier protein] reductase [Chloroflexota bacterium]